MGRSNDHGHAGRRMSSYSPEILRLLHLATGCWWVYSEMSSTAVFLEVEIIYLVRVSLQIFKRAVVYEGIFCQSRYRHASSLKSLSILTSIIVLKNESLLSDQPTSTVSSIHSFTHRPTYILPSPNSFIFLIHLFLSFLFGSIYVTTFSETLWVFNWQTAIVVVACLWSARRVGFVGRLDHLFVVLWRWTAPTQEDLWLTSPFERRQILSRSRTSDGPL